MFNNVGKKLMGVASVFTALGIIASFIIGIVLCAEEEVLAGFIVMAVGSFASWLSSLALYGFGQLIENTSVLVAQGQRTAMSRNYNANGENPAPYVKRCTACGTALKGRLCPVCDRDVLDRLNKWKADGLITEEDYNRRLEEFGK